MVNDPLASSPGVGLAGNPRATPPRPGQRREWTTQILTHLAFVAFIVVVGLYRSPGQAWTLVLIGTLVWFLAIGYQTTGYFFGILIDSRNRISLSRAQLIVWSIVVLSAFGVSALANVARGVADPLRVGIPEELWMLMGISTTSLIGSPFLLSAKEQRGAGKVAQKDPGEASIGDLVKGEDESDSDHVDLPRLQMAYFTVIVVLAYCVGIGGLFSGLGEREAIRELPGLDKGLLALMGISHTAYLAAKPIRGTPPSDGDADTATTTAESESSDVAPTTAKTKTSGKPPKTGGDI